MITSIIFIFLLKALVGGVGGGLVGALIWTLTGMLQRLRDVEIVTMYLGMERYQEMLAEAEEAALVESERKMIDSWHGETL